jgi:5-methylcytosine-specific restriction endonuclease McrA
LKNLELNIKRCHQWREDNPEKHLASKSRRRALELHAEGAWYGSDIGEMRIRQGNRCYWCCVSLKGIPTEVDHIVPLSPRSGSAGGSNWPDNLCLACRPCNRLKNRMMPLDFVLRLVANRCGPITGKSSRRTSNKQISLFVGH